MEQLQEVLRQRVVEQREQSGRSGGVGGVEVRAEESRGEQQQQRHTLHLCAEGRLLLGLKKSLGPVRCARSERDAVVFMRCSDVSSAREQFLKRGQ